MTVCAHQLRFKLEGQSKPVHLSFDAPHTSSDGGLLLLSQVQRKLRLLERLAPFVPDLRDQSKVKHSRLEQLKQKVFQICLGYEDNNDAHLLRRDPLFQFVLQKQPHAQPLSSQPTLCRFENAPNFCDLLKLQHQFEQAWIDSLSPNTRLILLDLDAFDDPTHGQQQLSLYHGFYGHYMLYPLALFDHNGRLVSLLLRRGTCHASRGASVLIERLLRAIRQRCPHAQVIIRADSGFSIPAIHECFDRFKEQGFEADFLLGQAQNNILRQMLEPTMALAVKNQQECQQKAVLFTEFEYSAATWSRARRVIGKAEVTSRGRNPRFVVTSLEGFSAEQIYRLYCERGQSENWIKDLKNALFAQRLSCSDFTANAFRLLLHGCAYRIMHALRSEVAEVSEGLGRSQFDTLRLQLLKVAVIVRVSARRVWLQFGECFVQKELFERLVENLLEEEAVT